MNINKKNIVLLVGFILFIWLAYQLSFSKTFALKKQNNLLSTINSFADTTNISIVSFQNPHVFKTNDTKTLTHSFTVKGNFNTITRLLFKLEQEYKLGNIISVNYQKNKNYRRNSEYLQCTILLQQVHG